MRKLFILIMFFSYTLYPSEIRVVFLPDQEFQVKSELYLSSIGFGPDLKDKELSFSTDIELPNIDGKYRIRTISVLGLTLAGDIKKRSVTVFIPFCKIKYIGIVRDRE